MRTVSRKYTRRIGQGYTKYYVSAGLFVFCAAMLSVILFARPDSMGLVGEDAYYNQRLSAEFDNYDTLSYGGRSSLSNVGLPFVLSLSPDFLVKYLPLILGLLSFVLFGLILSEFEVKEKSISLLLLAASPPFIYLFSTINDYFIAIFLALLGFYLFNKKEKFLMALSMTAFMLVPLFSFTITIVAGLLVLFLGLFKLKKNRVYSFVAVGLMALVALAYYWYISYNANAPLNLFFNLGSNGVNVRLMALFSDMGGKFGLAIFGLIISIFGMLQVWGKKYKDLFVFFSVFVLIILVFFRTEFMLVLNFFIAVFAAKGFSYLYHKDWANDTLKKMTVLVLVCGLIFSSVSFINEAISSEPDEGIQQGLEFLSRVGPGTVFSHPSRGKWINSAGKANVMDTNYLFAPEVYRRWDDTKKLFYTRDLNEALGIFRRYRIRYVWIDDGFKDDIWSHDEEGLLFLLKYDKDIKKIYDQGGVQIWRVQMDNFIKPRRFLSNIQ